MTADCNRLITVAIHTYDHALSLKSILEREGISVTLQNVNLSTPVVSSGVRVRIHEDDLPMALRIIENPDIFNPVADNAFECDSTVLLPLDFSKASDQICKVAFQLAHALKANIKVIHAYDPQDYSARIQLSDMLSFDDTSSNADNKTMIVNEAKRQCRLFSDSIVRKIKEGELPAVNYSTEILEGLPEESIVQYAKDTHPHIIVMSTRSVDDKDRDMLGSVTAEVLDTCRYPVFTVPESIKLNDLAHLNNIVFLSNFDQEDILALDTLFRLMPQKLSVKLVKVPNKKKDNDSEEMLNRLDAYCKKHYPRHDFQIDTISTSSIDRDFERIINNDAHTIIAVPNKKKNILARLFNPGIAHRLLFKSDIPMIVIPV
ncbi:MAG: universal stress protein [Bacteroides sp.]|nr:universal stress protein [Bacteroides sp.]